ncbi:GNAT family N-acetyltransferase [Flavobacterium luteum]|uniref:GNAT family N-acetyltransferase n=1 Tax=Flavobacterium luteum TaxID=2026654 RepID=A0A7J5AJS7_9FLAO|nr:GNAT family N-acetyltransferase [Flavobacterium luteum]KAB1157785.1 GNAT family N-acetyltransferase [Flavobacterium luteum]
MKVRQAIIDDLNELAQLFADYRVFYGQDFELEKTRSFIQQRLESKDSIIFIAIQSDTILGFSQLYPSFTTIGVQEIWILNDLFIKPKFRQNGVAKMLIEYILDYCKDTNRKKVILSTAYNNDKAQRLYEKLGFTKTKFYNYEKYNL